MLNASIRLGLLQAHPYLQCSTGSARKQKKKNTQSIVDETEDKELLHFTEIEAGANSARLT